MPVLTRKLSILVTAAATIVLAFAAGIANASSRSVNDDCTSLRIGLPLQGGDTINDAVSISVPCEVTGTTVGYGDDYEESCPSTSAAPDVVYICIPDQDINAEIDLLDSEYDTQVFVYDIDLDLVACNTDFFGDQSYLRNVRLESGNTYYVIVDGDLYSSGEYTMRINEYVPCDLGCAGIPEGEPPLVVGYEDEYNSGCFGSPVSPSIQRIEGNVNGSATLCGRSGWYLHANGQQVRDLDWFVVTVGPAGSVDIVFTQQEPMRLYHYSVGDCYNPELQAFWDGPYCDQEVVTIAGSPGTELWLPIIPLVSNPPDGSDVYEFDYILELGGLETGVATRLQSWSAIKASFR